MEKKAHQVNLVQMIQDQMDLLLLVTLEVLKLHLVVNQKALQVTLVHFSQD